MKLCPICDTKIGGSWCRRCGRFVTPVVFESRMYLNESHNMRKDADCEFHNPSRTHKETVKSSTVTRPRTRTAAEGAARTGKKSQEKSGNSATKIVKIIITIYILIFLLNLIFPLLMAAIDWSGIFDKLGSVSVTGKKEEVISSSLEPLGAEYIPPEVWGGEAMQQQGILLERTESRRDDGTVVYTYRQEDIRKLGFHCDDYHFPFTMEKLLSVMEAEYPKLTLSNFSLLWSDNYIYESTTGEELPEVYFSEFYCADMEADIQVYFDADTATNQVHQIHIRADENNEAVRKVAYDFIKVVVPEGYQSDREFEQVCNYARVWGDGIYSKSFDDVEITVRLQDGFDVWVSAMAVN